MTVMNARRRPLIASTALAGATALGMLTLSACGEGGADAADDGRLEVVASFYPMEFLAEEIGGDRVSVTTLTEPGVEPHDLELSPRQSAGLGDADVLVYLKGLQPAVDEAIEQAGVEHVAEAGSFTDLAHGDGTETQTVRDHPDDAHDHGEEPTEDAHGHGEDEHAEEKPAEDGHAEEPAEDGHGHDESDHDHGGEDPHVWLDPVKYAEIAKGVGKTLEKADPDHAADYRKNTDDLVKRLGTLDKDFSAGLETARSRTFITTHAAFGHLASRYDLDQEGIAGLDPESEPSAARMKELHTTAEKEKVTTVFFETIASDKTAKTLAGDLNLKTAVLDPLEGITDKSPGEDYFEVMRANLTALQKALGAA